MSTVAGIAETCLYARDLAAAERFYADVIGLEVYSRLAGKFVFFRCGGGMLLIFNPDASLKGENLPAHGASGPGHVAFAIRDAEIDDWRRHLEGAGVPVEHEEKWGDRGRSLYFRDPAGNSVEVTTPHIWGLPEPQPAGRRSAR
jgi:catechol 2,3-dioxygenase-like lactoylglutathione lyase family enzyme